MRSMFFSLITIILLTGCAKDVDNGIIRFHLIYKNGRITGKVYIKADTLFDPGIAVEAYDEMVPINNYGRGWHTSIKPGRYFFKATGYLQGATLSGTQNLVVRARYRLNNYDVYIMMQ